MSSSAPLPALTILDAVALTVGAAPSDAQALGFTVFTTGDVPAELGLDRAALERAGFTGKAGSSPVLPPAEGPAPVAAANKSRGRSAMKLRMNSVAKPVWNTVWNRISA